MVIYKEKWVQQSINVVLYIQVIKQCRILKQVNPYNIIIKS